MIRKPIILSAAAALLGGVIVFFAFFNKRTVPVSGTVAAERAPTAETRSGMQEKSGGEEAGRPDPADQPPAPHAVLKLPNELKTPEDVLALVDVAATTHRAIVNGGWDDPATWGGQVPTPGARVHIPQGVTVSLDGDTAHLKSVRLDGGLNIAPTEAAQLTVDTMVVNTTGSLTAGTPQAPLAGGVEALVSIEAYLDPNDSPEMRKHSAQLIAMGEVSLNGEPKSGMGLLSRTPMQGDRELLLEQEPVNWRPGDLITIAGDRAGRDEVDALQVKYVKGNRVGIEPAGVIEGEWNGLTQSRETGSDQRGFVVNMSRNVGISTSAPAGAAMPEAPRGTVIFQGDGVGKATLSNVGIYGLGEPEAILPGVNEVITRPAIAFHQNGDLTSSPEATLAANVLSTAANAKPSVDPFCITPSGTPGLPANRIGETATGPAAVVNGIALVDAPENGIAINGSAVSIRGAVSSDAEGGGWLTENGSPSRLVWTAKRTVRGIVGGGLP